MSASAVVTVLAVVAAWWLGVLLAMWLTDPFPLYVSRRRREEMHRRWTLAVNAAQESYRDR